MAESKEKKFPAPKEGLVTLQAPDGCNSCSHEGETYEVDKDGFVRVPPDAVSALKDHGFAGRPVK